MPIDVHAEINPQDRIDEIWNAWAKMDGEASIRDIVRRAVEQKAGAKHRRFEALELKKKKLWGVPGTRRWQLHMQHLPTSQANGTYGRLGAPFRMENMNLHRADYYGGGPPLDVASVTRLRRPLRVKPTKQDRFGYQAHGYEWYKNGHDSEHDQRRALDGPPRHVVSSNFSSNSTNRFEAPVCLESASSTLLVGTHSRPARSGDGAPAPPPRLANSVAMSRSGRFRDFSSLNPKICVTAPRAEEPPMALADRARGSGRPRPGGAGATKGRRQPAARELTASEKRDKYATDMLYHPLGAVVAAGPDPADVADATLAEYRRTLRRLRARAPP